MAKPIAAVVKLQVPAGQATPAPPVGTALGPHGVNIMEVVKQFNAKTAHAQGMITPVEVTIFKDRTYTLITTPPPRDAVERVKAAAYAKFDESVDVAVRLGVDPKHADQVVRGTVSLPNGTGKKVRVLVIAQGEKAKEAEAAGADFVGVEYVQKI